MAAPQGKTPINGETYWNDDGLADDVASISYEHALRAHTRVRTEIAAPPPATHDSPHLSAGPEKPLKTASITIRLSDDECARLRKRATEAGMTISAYLRSCTLEVESLRAEVKETLAQLRNSTPAPRAQDNKAGANRLFTSVPARLWHWLEQLWPHRRHALSVNPANPFAPVHS
jgi:hypothetical protein